MLLIMLLIIVHFLTKGGSYIRICTSHWSSACRSSATLSLLRPLPVTRKINGHYKHQNAGYANGFAKLRGNAGDITSPLLAEYSSIEPPNTLYRNGFRITSDYQHAGDQPAAIEALVQHLDHDRCSTSRVILLRYGYG